MKNKLLCIFIILLLPFTLKAAEFPFSFSDSTGKEIEIKTKPQRIVSLVPSVTEMLFQIGAADAVVGTTHHSLSPPGTSEKRIVGGFSSPDIQRIKELEPDIIFYSSMHEDVIAHLGFKVTTVLLSANSIEESFHHITLLGQLFDLNEQAEKIVRNQKLQLERITAKIAKIPATEKKRVIRLMARNKLMVPGDDSFQNEYIDAAGGIAPKFGRNGTIISLELEEWQKFNPQIIYLCGKNSKQIPVLQQPGWKEVDAVKKGRVLTYHCNLTCRASTNTGNFVSVLAADLYHDAFSDRKQQVAQDHVVRRTPLNLNLDYLEKAEIIDTTIRDFDNKSVLLTFNQPMNVVSTLEGYREGLYHVGNHYFPPPSWKLGHESGLSGLYENTLNVLGLQKQSTAMLFTGADMDNLAVIKKSYRDMDVTALVTAGVAGNALRMAFDEGKFYEPETPVHPDKPGTINILLLSNMQLTPRAMTRAIISGTEGKTAALQDLNIRSSYTSVINPATGTGTDNMIVVEGSGTHIDSSGGHTKMGELIASAVYDGVRLAIHKQNGFGAERSIFQRIRERKLDLHKLTKQFETESTKLGRQIEELLLTPRYSSFLAAALTISDDFERGLISDTSGFDLWCQTIAKEIAGRPIQVEKLNTPSLPLVLQKAFGSLLSGLREKEQDVATEKVYPRRIISLGPINTENVYLLGAGELLVGNTEYCVRPANAKTKMKIGSVMQISIEKIISLKPDIILATGLTQPQQIEQLRRLGLRVEQFDQPKSFAQSCDQFMALGKMLGMEKQAGRIIKRLQTDVDKIRDKTAELPRKKVFLQIGTRPLHGAPKNTFTADYIKLAGGVNIIENQESGKTNSEKVLVENPDVIIIAIMGSETGIAGQEKRNWFKFPFLKAVQDNQVHIINPDITCSPSPQTFVQTLQTIAGFIHPQIKSEMLL